MSPDAAAARGRTVAWLVAVLVPVVCAAAWMAGGVHGGRLRPRGDEPHYLVTAASWARDHDFDVRDDYAREAREHRFAGDVTPHATRLASGWFPFHMVGLSVWIALPLEWGGVLGARASLLAFAALLAATVFRWLSAHAGATTAAWLTVAVTVSLPVVFGATQLYPDLPGGAVAAALAVWWLVRDERAWTVAESAGFAVLAGALPWLHVKFLGTTAVLGGAVLSRAWRVSRRSVPLVALLLVAGTVSLMAFHARIYGSVVGHRTVRELTTSPSRAIEIFLGLHADQSQGLFVQQPLWLLAVPALAAWLRREPARAAWWCLLYGSLVAPNSLEIARYGTAGPVGRFGWAASFLWAVPLGLALRRSAERWRRWAAPLAAAALAYQALLASSWMADPAPLYPVLDQGLAGRDSLFPSALAPWLPSFYDWTFRGFWLDRPNLLALAAIAIAAAWGLLSPMRARDARAWMAGALASVAAIAVLVPARPGAGASGDASESALRVAPTFAPRRYEAEALPSLVGRRADVPDPGASGGAARSSRPEAPARVVTFGPYDDLPAGDYRVTLAIRQLGHAPGPFVGTLDVVAERGRRLLAARTVATDELAPDGAYVLVTTGFGSRGPLADVELRFVAEPGAQVWLDYLELAPAGASGAEPGT